jgi:D-3-phosphoglycerate dehydrogenase
MRFLICEPDGFSEDAIAELRAAGHQVRAFDAGKGTLEDALADAEGILVRLGIHWDRARLAQAPKLRVLLTPTTGLDHIDLAAAAERGIRVISLRGLKGLDEVTSTPELAFALLLALARNLPSAVASVREGRWNRDLFVGRELRGKRVGLIGCGRTGQAFARMCAGFAMPVCYYDPYVDLPGLERVGSLAELAERCEILSAHVILNAETEGLLDEAFFQACRKKPWLINTSRGAIADEAALLRALADGRLSGAAVDVLRGEPEKGKPLHSAMLDYARGHENLLITPHIAGATWDAMRHTENMIVRAFLAEK